MQIFALLGAGLGIAYGLDRWAGHDFPTLLVSASRLLVHLLINNRHPSSHHGLQGRGELTHLCNGAELACMLCCAATLVVHLIWPARQPGRRFSGMRVQVLAVFGSFVSYIYSAPPLKLKQSGWAGNYALGSSYIALPWWAGQVCGLFCRRSLLLYTIYTPRRTYAHF